MGFFNLCFIYKPCGFPSPKIHIFITLMDVLVKEANAYQKLVETVTLNNGNHLLTDPVKFLVLLLANLFYVIGVVILK